eukprot:Anaeramoba_ignava/a348081_1922.p1 GENE.a348081_1922~~a348081_1922.p1  ORF type:complete len:428 (-),score=76.86 a348081_1922:84-1367(-)
MTDLYVSFSTGTNSGNGQKDKPFKFLWKALNKAQAGDTVHVAEGRYPGQTSSGVMPKITQAISIIGGYTTDFSTRNPFEHLTIIGPKPDTQGKTDWSIKIEPAKAGKVIVDGFCIDRGQNNYYYGAGPPGPNNKIEGLQDNTAWGYGQLNRKSSGSCPTIEILNRGENTVRNCILINNAWWGIYVKCGGDSLIENNFILSSQGRAIEAIPGGGWGKPTITIKNNTVLFGHSLKTTEGRALSTDPRDEKTAKYVIENNVLAFNHGGGVTTKFNPKEGSLVLNNNKFWFNRRADLNFGAGTGTANAQNFEDDLEFDTEGNVHEIPKALALLEKDWFDKWTADEFVDICAGNFVDESDLMQSREVLGLKEFHLVGYKDTYDSYAKLPKMRPKFDMCRYPFPMKKGDLLDWKTILPVIGADGDFGVQAFKN